MFKPRRMSRVLIAGPIGALGPAIEALHQARTLHITDYAEQDEGFKLGAPLQTAAESSEKLLKLRSASKVLGIEGEVVPGERRPAHEVENRADDILAELERTVAVKDGERQKLEAQLAEAKRRIEACRPFAALPLRFESYRPYETLAVYTGTVSAPFEGELAALGTRHELFKADEGGFFALFVDKADRARVERLLAQKGYTEVKVPEENGEPAKVVSDNEMRIGEITRRLKEIQAELAQARQVYVKDILAIQEDLGIKVEKAEAPLRFATTRSSFVIEGWVPASDVDRTENLLLKKAGTCIHIERAEEEDWEEGGGEGVKAPEPAGHIHGKEPARHAEPYENVPIALANPAPVKPFETLTEMFSVPSYKEIDPTIVLALIFPFFFGFMVGDLAYGILLMVTGVAFMTRLKRYEGFRELGWYILVAGTIAAIFGALVFGDCFGIPFHAASHGEGGEAMSWSSLLGVDIPIKASIHKLEVSGLATLMMISIIAGIIHLSLGNIFGIINEWRHDRRHAVAKVGWLLTVLGFGLIMLKAGEVTKLGAWLWSGLPSALGVSWNPGIGVLFPYSSLVMVITGLALAIAGEGGMAIMEVAGVVSNLLSYTRLAAIGIAKGAMAFAFNSILVPIALGGNIGLALVGWLLLVLAHMMVFVLGGLSSGIQALRLNLVEFFMKFFRGGGIKFNPFGRVRIYTKEDSGG